MTNVEVRVRSSYSALSPTCQKAADYLLAHTRELYSIPIAELARQSGVRCGFARRSATPG